MIATRGPIALALLLRLRSGQVLSHRNGRGLRLGILNFEPGTNPLAGNPSSVAFLARSGETLDNTSVIIQSPFSSSSTTTKLFGAIIGSKDTCPPKPEFEVLNLAHAAKVGSALSLCDKTVILYLS